MKDSEQARHSNGILLFLGIVTVLSALMWVLSFAPTPFKGGGGGHYVEALMWCPAIAAFLTILTRGIRTAELGLGRFGGKYAITGYLIPLGYAAIAYVVVWSFGFGGFPNMEGIAKLAARTGWQVGAPSSFIPPYFLLVATTSMVGATARTLGEEIGWRGFLAPRMVARFGFTWGAILTGVVWAFWHLPLILLGTYNNGTPWWFGFSCFSLGVISFSVVLTWLRLKSASVWPCALCHASHNVFVQTFFTPLTAAKGAITAYAIDEFGFAVPLAISVVAIYLWRNRFVLEDEPNPVCS
jgi:membrane protease YdiL (CAAX protease family)